VVRRRFEPGQKSLVSQRFVTVAKPLQFPSPHSDGKKRGELAEENRK